MRRGPGNLQIVADGIGLTQFGGVGRSSIFLASRLRGAFARHVRFVQRNKRCSISESLEALLYPLVLGLHESRPPNHAPQRSLSH